MLKWLVVNKLSVLGPGCSYLLPSEDHIGCECLCGPSIPQYQPVCHPHCGHGPAQLATGNINFRLMEIQPVTVYIKMDDMSTKSKQKSSIWALLSSFGSSDQGVELKSIMSRAQLSTMTWHSLVMASNNWLKPNLPKKLNTWTYISVFLVWQMFHLLTLRGWDLLLGNWPFCPSFYVVNDCNKLKCVWSYSKECNKVKNSKLRDIANYAHYWYYLQNF